MSEIDETKAKTTTAPATEDAKPDVKPDSDEVAKLKAALSRANSEAADWKRQYKATLDEQKQKEMEAADKRKAELEELETMRRERRVNIYAKRLMEAGYDAGTADQMANSLPDGVADTYFESAKAFNEKQKQLIAASALDNQKGLSVGMPLTAADAQKEATNRMRSAFGLPLIP